MSADLTWLLVRGWNSFQRKSSNGPIFSAEQVRIQHRRQIGAELRPNSTFRGRNTMGTEMDWEWAGRDSETAREGMPKARYGWAMRVGTRR